MSELGTVDRLILRVLLARLRTAVDGHNRTHTDIQDLRFVVFRIQIAVLIRMIRRFWKSHPEAKYQIAHGLDLIGASCEEESVRLALTTLADEVDP